MKFPKKYIKYGNFKLHSGDDSNIFYDVNALLTDKKYRDFILDSIPFSNIYVGIATGGAIIAALTVCYWYSQFGIIKDGELKGKIRKHGKYILIDDVITTGQSINEAIKIIGWKPTHIIAVVDRRINKSQFEVYSIFEEI